MLQPTQTPCACGRTHAPLDVRVVIGEGALGALAPVAAAADGAPLLLFDAITFALLGERLIAALGPLGERSAPLILGAPGKPFEPNSEAIAAVMTAAREARGLVVGVGSGAVNDLGKYVAAQLERPYACVATAPSMDGYAAPISALFLDGVKTTVDSKRPDAIVSELDVLLGAPAPLVAAGFGDVLGKLTSLTDWGLGRALLDEYYCERIAGDVRAIALDVYERAGEIAQRTPAALGKLMAALVETGLSVSYVGNSRPTSGAEHLVSHFVEMWSLNRDSRPPAHGHVVGVATLCASEIAAALAALAANDLPKEAPPIDQALPEVLGALKLAESP
ncbi:MAG TPA: iron-containing alcohol dehydrogenase, partial [Limnochordia bacterium]|nr:iron-containing alcohol dehydrogenase [Limnochordia bacterium]